MPAVKGRAHRPKATASPTVLLQGRVPPEVRELASGAADAAGISLASYLEALVLADAEECFVRPAGPYRQERLPA